MNESLFRLVNAERGPLNDPELLRNRPGVDTGNTFAQEADKFVPGEQLETAINTAIAVGEPLLITGEAGAGKTTAAYFAAWNLGIAPVIHFQVKSDSQARDLLYHYDMVRYFHDASLRQAHDPPLNKADYVERRALWEAIESATPRVLLIDQIDKAPRDFPNDLLHELNQMEFTVTETGQTIKSAPGQRPIVFITSNSERRLPEPFLRRCVYHHIRFDDTLVRTAVEKHREVLFPHLKGEIIELAITRFLKLREKTLRKTPATGELLVWLRVLALAAGTYPEHLPKDLAELPYLGALLKDHQDIEELGRE